MSSAGGLPAWGRQAVRHRGGLIDAIAAAALTAGALWAVTTLTSDHWTTITAVSAALCTTAVGWRRRAPVPAALVALVALVVYQRVGHDTQGSFVVAAIVLTCYSVGRRGADRAQRRSLEVLLGCALAACTAIDAGSGFSVFGVLLTWVPVAVLPAGAGLLVERRARLIQDLMVAESQLRDEQSVRTERLLAEERTRVARELHDVVAHCVSVMVIQAGAARLVAASDAAAARQALDAVVSSGRDAMADLRRVVGVLRRHDDEFGCAALGLDGVDRLLERLRAGGLQVRCRTHGERVELPAELDLTAFRIVQEALTNVLKHARSAQAELSIAYGKQALELRIEDSGPAASPDPGAAHGHGLVGMCERVALHGGEVRIGSTATGGFVVCVRLPLSAAVVQPVAEVAAALPVDGRRAHVLRRLTPQAVDAVFAAGWLVALEIEALTSSHRTGPVAANVAVVAAMAAVAVIRRRAPFVFLAVVGALTLALSGGLASPARASLVGAYSLFVGSYTIAACQPRRRALAGLGVVLVGVVVTTVVQHAAAGAAFGGGLMACLVWLLGRLVRQQRELTAALEDANARLSAEREERALIALYDERARIARDLHTLVARLVTAMVVQSEAADELVATHAASADSAIRAIEHTGRQALSQMRHMLGVLRNEHRAGPVHPQAVATALPVRAALLDAVPS